MKFNESQYYGALDLEREIFKAGYVRSPNNIHALPSVHWLPGDPNLGASPIWYAGGPGIHEPKLGVEVQVCSDRIRLFSLKFFGQSGEKASFWDTVTEAVFTSVPDFLAWCQKHGRFSEPGLPAFTNGWD